jgi:dolichol-phosphate mannosyltransferase
LKAGSISLIIPCFNEEATLPELYARISAVADTLPGRAFEVLFVDDGSTDGTAACLDALADRDPRVKVVHLARNRGHQIALMAGIDCARGDALVTLDGDLQDPPELVPELLARIEEGFDVVHARRRRRAGETVFKLLTAKLFYWLIRHIGGVSIVPDCGDFRAFTPRVQQTVRRFRAPHVFLRGLFVEAGFRQCVVPYDRAARHAGSTKYPLRRMIGLALDAALGFSAAPIRVISGLSLVLWGISIIYLVHSLVMHFVFAETVKGWTSLICLLFFFTGLILFCMAIIGAYVGRIFVQGQRPLLYWVSDVRNLDPEALRADDPDNRELRLAARACRSPEEAGADTDGA